MSKSVGYPTPVMQAFTAGADLSALQYSFVKYGADEQHVVGCGADEIPLGVLMNAPASGKVAEVAIAGGALVKASNTVAKNDSLGSAASGQSKTITSGPAFAISLKSGVANDVLPVLIDRHTGRTA